MIERASRACTEPLTSGRLHRDVLVIGAGPAGTTAARLLAEQGHDVLVVDKRAFPREKVCGDGLIPDALNGLRRAGLYAQVVEEGWRTDRLSVFSASGVGVDLPGEFVTLRRRRLDHLLLEAALKAGVEFRVGRVVELRDGPGGSLAVFARSGIEIGARITVVATGADRSLVDRGHGSPYRAASAVALRCYTRSPIVVDRLIISFDRSVTPGYAWIFPLGNGEYNVGCGVFERHRSRRRVNLREMFRAFTQRFPLATDLWRQRTHTTRPVGARLRCGLNPSLAYAGAHVVAVGETIGATFPFTGEGIGKAIETSEIAAVHIDAALRADTPAPLLDYARRLEDDLTAKYTGYRIAETWLSRPWVGNWLAGRMRRSPTLQQVATGVVNETADPRALFSVRRLLPEFLPWRSRQ